MGRLKRCQRTVSLLLLIALGVIPVWPQTPKAYDKWWKNEKIRIELGLTPQQTNQLEKVMGEFRDRLNSLARELESKRKERERLVKEEGYSPETYRTLTNQIYNLKSELERIHLTFRIKLGEVLTPRQKSILKKIQSR